MVTHRYTLKNQQITLSYSDLKSPLLILNSHSTIEQIRMTNEFSGGCLCGAIRFKATSPANPHTCSCDICQKHTGAQSAVWIEFSTSNVQWIGEGGKPATYRSSPASSRAFCPRCGSSIGAIDDGPIIALLSGVFDNPNDPALAPEYHSFEDMKPEWWQKLFPDSPP